MATFRATTSTIYFRYLNDTPPYGPTGTAITYLPYGPTGTAMTYLPYGPTGTAPPRPNEQLCDSGLWGYPGDLATDSNSVKSAANSFISAAAFISTT